MDKKLIVSETVISDAGSGITLTVLELSKETQGALTTVRGARIPTVPPPSAAPTTPKAGE
jgi:hypothetical protein